MRFRRVRSSGGLNSGPRVRPLLSAILLLTSSTPYASRACHPPSVSAKVSNDPATGARARGVRELVPEKYLKKYERWKTEYLSTEAGRRQWERYAADENFTLTIVVSPELGRGGVVGEYGWDASGRLVAATITLGDGLDAGLPTPLYYPVTSALAAGDGGSPGVSGDILAAAKFAHEFGHVNYAAAAATLYRRQSSLAAEYAKVFEESGYNARDPRVVEVARELGGTPFEIKKERELGAEANALVFLSERLAGEGGDGALFKKIKKSVKDYGSAHLELP